jgi:hypothetical protein
VASPVELTVLDINLFLSLSLSAPQVNFASDLAPHGKYL